CGTVSEPALSEAEGSSAVRFLNCHSERSEESAFPSAFICVNLRLMAFDLQRFVDAQSPIYSRVLAELRAGEKRTHWMWFIFPQLAGLGHSQMSQTYAIASLDEARAY